MSIYSPESAPYGKIDISNWRQAHNNKWAFNHVNEIIPTTTVENDSQRSFIFRHTEENINDPLFEQLLAETETDAIIVLHKGRIVHEQYANGNNKDTHHILMSATKAVIGLLAGIIEQKGMIVLKTPVSAYIPELHGTTYGSITLRNLLDMRCGIILNKEQEMRYAKAANWDPVPPTDTRIGLHDFYLELNNLQPTSDDTFRYISANTDLLGWAIERATGQPVNKLLSEIIWQPMGAEHPAYMTVDINGAARCTGGLCATIRDFALLGQSIIGQGGQQQGIPAIIPSTLLDDIAENGDREAWQNGEWGKAFAAISDNMAYRSGWYIIHSDPKLIFAMGIYGQYLFLDPFNQIVIAKFSSWKDSLDYSAISKTHQLVARIRSILTGETV